ncbi:MAG TPA: TIGR03435 family protein [Acidobacteriaceae bacterium]|nr:TIGR03435 family protein [Acidobacteriaceae bacterium]
MKKLMLLIVALGVLMGGALRAQDFAGRWQGTLKDSKDLRLILVVSEEGGKLQGKLYSIDETPLPYTVSSISQDGSTVKFAIDLNGTAYEGKMNAAKDAIAGTWTQGVTKSLPLEFSRASKETAWEIPAPPAPRKLMPADADPSFEVATIKPNHTDGASMQALTFKGRNFITVNSSLADLMMFAYSVQMKQIIGAPDWIEKDRYDIVATPAEEGRPSADQVRVMIRKLLADRFQLKFHHDKREMSAFVLTVGKGGARLRPGQRNGSLHGIGMQEAANGSLLFVNNAPIPAFTSFLQSLVLDRPVVDETGLTGRYDFTVTFTPDESEFNGHPPITKPADGVEPAPSLFEAIQEQLGLKLSPEKTQVDVLAIDHVEKPSAN